MTIGLGSALGVMGFRRRHFCSGGIVPGGFIPVLPCSGIASRAFPPQAVPIGVSAPMTTPGDSIITQGGPQTVQLDVSMSVVVAAGQTLQVFATVDGVQVGAVILLFIGNDVPTSQSGIAAVSVPDGTHVVGLQLVASGPITALGSGTLVARGCFGGVIDQG